MRLVLIAGLSLAGLSPVALNAAILEFSFSGVFGPGFGVVNTGDAFSGTGIWNDAERNASLPIFSDLTSLTLTLPSADGLSVASLPDAAVLFAGAGYAGAGSTFNELRLNIKSSADNNIYSFTFAIPAGCPGSVCNAAVQNANFTQTDRATTYSPSGPTTLSPEPKTSLSIATGLALLLALFLIRRYRSQS